MRRVLEAVLLRLKEQVPELRYVAMEAGQMSAGGGGMLFPAALADVASVEYLPAAKGLSRPTVRVEVELLSGITQPAASFSLARSVTSASPGGTDRGACGGALKNTKKPGRLIRAFLSLY